VQLVRFGGKRQVHGFNNLVNGDTSGEAQKQQSIALADSLSFKNSTP
jgi:hypothetical protein